MAEKAIRLGGESTADAIVSAVDAMYTEHTFAEKDFALKHNDDEIAVDTAGLAAYQLCDIRVFLLRHDTASCAVCIIDFHKLVFIGVPDNDFLGKTGKVHHDRRTCR